MTIIIITCAWPADVRYKQRKSVPSRQACSEHHGCSGSTLTVNTCLQSCKRLLCLKAGLHQAHSQRTAICEAGRQHSGTKLTYKILQASTSVNQTVILCSTKRNDSACLHSEWQAVTHALHINACHTSEHSGCHLISHPPVPGCAVADYASVAKSR